MLNKDLIYTGKYFYITTYKLSTKKTSNYNIYTHDNILIGQIKWYAHWRKYCFYPEIDTIWDSKCLQEISNFLTDINISYRKEQRNE